MPNESNKITKNSFSGGRDSDTNVSVLPPDRYIAAHNVDFVANGNFYGLQNLISSTNLAQFVNDPNIIEIGSAPCKFTISGVLTYCIIYFTMSSTTGTYNIWMFNTEAQTLHPIYQENYAAGYNTPDRVVDIINYPENGVDHLYFADAFNEVRHLTCIYPTASPLNPYDLSLQRGGTNGTISLVDIMSGGSLLTGTYQFAYRMCDPATKRFGKWSYITNPVHVYDADNTDPVKIVSAGIGLISNRRIILNITPSANEILAFPFIQLAVIENIAATPAITVSLQDFLPYTGGTSMQITYGTNTRVASVPLDSFVIDPAQILSAKTLRTTNNRLFLGNINYVDLRFNSPFGLPSIPSGTIISRTSVDIGIIQGDCYSSDKFSSMYMGYFRDEVYRFGVIYKDKFGNKSYVSPLDMRNITDNQASFLSAAGDRDMKFPSRSFDKKYTLFANNGLMQGLGLSFSLQNHPTWAVSLEIVRVPRKKNILFQSPAIPMMSVDGTGAIGSYPSKFNSITSSTPVDTGGAQPMSAGKVLVPKNMFWPEGRDITGFSTNTPASGGQPSVVKGEVFLNNFPLTCLLNTSMLFPTADMYGDNLPAANGEINKFVYTGAEKVEFIDMALLRLNYQTGSNGFTSGKTPYVIGEDINTNISGNFFALLDGDYFFDSNWVAKTPPNASYSGSAMTGYQFYDNFGVTAPVTGQSVMDYEALSTKGFQFGFQPNIQRSAVASFNFNGGFLSDPTFSGATFANGTLNPYGSGGGFIIGSGGTRYQSNTQLDNSYLPEPTTYGLGQNAICQAVNIVNITLGLGDNRYGELNALHTYQSTAGIFPSPELAGQNVGVYSFSDAEQASLRAGGQVYVDLQVWGGDCFVAAHTFKVCDSTYSVTASGKGRTPRVAQTIGTANVRWGGWWDSDGGPTIASLPVAVENASQFITVVLESEYNGTVRDKDILTGFSALSGVPILNNPSVATARSPLNYRYNFNLSRGNYQKVYSTFLRFSFQQFHYDSRVAYSNIKIYNSDVSGFDTFSVADFVDLPEQRYAITSLGVAADMLYALQERGIVYLPTSSRQIEQSDASTLVVTSGDVIGRPVVVSTERGTQHLRTVQEIGNMIFLTDNKNKEFYVLTGTDLSLITKDQQTVMKQIWASQFPENSVKGVYDFVNEQWLTILPSGIQVYDHARNIWIGDYKGFAFDRVPHGGSYQKGIVYMTAFNGVTSNFCVHSLYTGAGVNNLFGNVVDPSVSFVVNPDEAFSKTFDVMMVDADNQLLAADLQVVYDTTSAPSVINGLNLAVPNIENNYRIPLGTDANGYRLRGMRMLVTAHWGTLQAQLKSIFTKYRYSKRLPF